MLLTTTVVVSFPTCLGISHRPQRLRFLIDAGFWRLIALCISTYLPRRRLIVNRRGETRRCTNPRDPRRVQTTSQQERNTTSEGAPIRLLHIGQVVKVGKLIGRVRQLFNGGRLHCYACGKRQTGRVCQLSAGSYSSPSQNSETSHMVGQAFSPVADLRQTPATVFESLVGYTTLALHTVTFLSAAQLWLLPESCRCTTFPAIFSVAKLAVWPIMKHVLPLSCVARVMRTLLSTGLSFTSRRCFHAFCNFFRNCILCFFFVS